MEAAGPPGVGLDDEELLMRELGYFVLLCAAAVILLAVAWVFLVRGGRLSLKAGKVEATVDATKILREIHADTKAINKAVNQVAPGEPPLVDQVKAIREALERHIGQTGEGFEAVRADVRDVGAQLQTHIATAVGWQQAVAGSRPDVTWPEPG